MSTDTVPESEIRALITDWAAAIQRCDLSQTLDRHSEDIVMFDVPQPDRGVRGLAEYRASWLPFYDWIRAGARFEIDELHIEAGDAIAFAWALLWCGTADDRDRHPERRLRLSLGLRRSEEGWQVVHEHHSFVQD